MRLVFTLEEIAVLFLNREANVCLPVCLSICLSVYLSICLSVYLSICQSVSLSVCLSICPSVHLSMSVCLSVCLFVCLSFRPLVLPPIYLSLHLCPSVFFMSVSLLLSDPACFWSKSIYYSGIFNEQLGKKVLSEGFTSKITPEMNATWYETRGEGVYQSLRRFLLVYLGEPLTRLIRYGKSVALNLV